MPNVLQYDDIPEKLRYQIIYILLGSLGNAEQFHNSNLYFGSGLATNHVRKSYSDITTALCIEYGIPRLPMNCTRDQNALSDLLNFFLKESDTGKVLDVIELSFNAVDQRTRSYHYLNRHDAQEIANQAIICLNKRFNEHGIGYQYENGKIIIIDSKFIHSEVMKPALKILNQRDYAGAQEEFLRAHAHYRAGRAKEALNECLKSLESVLKSICKKRGWDYEANATAKKLIDICFDNGIVPQFWIQHFNTLRSLLASGVPTARNKLGAHGQGSEPQSVPSYLVSFVLHMTAATIVFLADAEANDAVA